MEIETVEYDTPQKLILALIEISQDGKLFRGHSDREWRLIPSATRSALNNLSKNENDDFNALDLITQIRTVHNNLKLSRIKKTKDFYQLCASHGIPLPDLGPEMHAELMGFSRPLSSITRVATSCPGPEPELWSLLSLMQHYKIETELLDWTRNPLVALFFATEGSVQADGCVWEFEEAPINSAPPHSTVSWSGSLLGFRSPLEGGTDCAIFLERPTYIENSRIKAQNGVLSISVLDHRKSTSPLEDGVRSAGDAFDFAQIYMRLCKHLLAVEKFGLDTPPTIKRHIVRNQFKHELRRYLSNMKIDTLSVYPEIGSIGGILE
ncbi:FRG domain-containing protein [Maricaulis sp. CAU 1757]